ncbi:MAG TPA: DUF368 domain-containing protein [Methanocorpusculum sp.]|nr:DUF368 domain-containing protein [Methanocorpusculum sp.]
MRRITYQHLIDIISGIAMSMADSVPGVSGGTILFLLGYYEKFICSMNNFLLGTNADRKAAFPFLFKLGCGWIGGFLVCILILSTLFQSYIYEISSIFIGLTLSSIPIVILEEKAYLKGHYLHLIFTVGGIVLVPILMDLSSLIFCKNDVDLMYGSVNMALFLFFAAILVVVALVLPGISGSTLLLIMGLYFPLISAIAAVLRKEFVYIPMLFSFGCGLIAGFVISTRVIYHCFTRYRSQIIYFCVGLLIGSLYAIVLGSTTLFHPLPAMNWETFQFGFCIFGIGIFVILHVVKHMVKQRFSYESHNK